MTSPCMIGVDGGGSKTELLLLDAAGAVLARHTAPGCNPNLAGAGAAHAVLTTALADLLARAPGGTPAPVIGRTLLCMAGNPAFWRETAAGLTGWGRVDTATDAVPVLELATGGAPGLVLHAGTGSFVAARGAEGTVHYAGGLGWRLGDPGSGYDLGRRGIARALLELQGWAEPTPLGPALCAHLGMTDAPALVRRLYSDPAAAALLAGFAPQVLAAAAAGCAPAHAILEASLGELVDQGRAVTSRLFPGATDLPCGVSGALLNQAPAPAVLEALARRHGWRVRYQFITEPPIEGVRRLLLRA